jgi:uncharacterized membrane protein
MHAKANILGHPIHQMLIVFPLGLLATSVAFDIAHFVNNNNPRWGDVSFWMITAGVIGGLAAAVFGLIDYLAIPSGTRAKSIGATHGIGNLIVMGLFITSWFLRWPDPGMPTATAFALSLVGLALALFTGWLGGELVDRLGVGVDEGANLNAPSSLSGQPAGCAADVRRR